jgi:hypothetical protein
MFYGSIIFRVIGTIAIWAFFNTIVAIRVSKSKNHITLKEIWNGVENSENHAGKDYAFLAIITGFILSMIICSLLVFL